MPTVLRLGRSAFSGNRDRPERHTKGQPEHGRNDQKVGHGRVDDRDAANRQADSSDDHTQHRPARREGHESVFVESSQYEHERQPAKCGREISDRYQADEKWSGVGHTYVRAERKQ